MKRYMLQNWNNIAEPELYLHEEGYYIVKFQTTMGDHIVLTLDRLS